MHLIELLWIIFEICTWFSKICKRHSGENETKMLISDVSKFHFLCGILWPCSSKSDGSISAFILIMEKTWRPPNSAPCQDQDAQFLVSLVCICGWIRVLNCTKCDAAHQKGFVFDEFLLSLDISKLMKALNFQNWKRIRSTFCFKFLH